MEVQLTTIIGMGFGEFVCAVHDGCSTTTHDFEVQGACYGCEYDRRNVPAYRAFWAKNLKALLPTMKAARR